MSGVVRLIAGREITSRLQQKGFRFGALVFIVLIGVVALLPKFIGGGDSSTTFDVGIVTQDRTGPAAADIRAAIAQLQQSGGLTIHVRDVATAAIAQDEVRGGDLDAVLDGNRILSRSASSTPVALLAAARDSVIAQSALSAAGLSPAQIESALSPPPLSVTIIGAGDSDTRKAIATLSIVVLFAQLITFCSWVGMGVVEEKTSRVVELVLSTVRPWQLLTGKLLGIGALAIGQLVAAGVVGLAVVRLSGSFDLPSGAYTAVGISFLWFVFGFAFFAAMAAALCSLVSRQEEVSGVMMPVSALLMVSYALGFASVGSSDSTLARVLSVLPPMSAISMPARAAAGDVPWWELALSLALLALAAAAMLAVAGRIYRAAVLHAGSRVPLRTAWRGEAAASLR
jgi:ABC-2 type transport system permease protein